jgi:hypothetical protein
MSKKQAPDWLVPIVTELLVNEADTSGIPLSHLCNPNRKTRPIAQARWRIMKQLRRDYTLAGYFPGKIASGEAPPISFPIIGWLLDLDHSAVVHAINNNKREQAKAVAVEPAAEGAEV